MRPQRIIVFFAALFLPGTPLFSQQADPLSQALKDELDRSWKKLQMPKMERPYHILYRVADWDIHRINAALGAVLFSNRERHRGLNAQVRVGNRRFDNTGFRARGLRSSRAMEIPEEDDYDSLRHALWIATDEAYKSSLEVLHRKRAFFKNQLKTSEEDDFSQEPSVLLEEEKGALRINPGEWEGRMKALSAIFKKYPRIQTSQAAFIAAEGTHYLHNTEGTRVRARAEEGSNLALAVRAKAQAKDGMVLNGCLTFFGNLEKGFPMEAVSKSIEKMAKDLSLLTEAPLIADYSGPVLFEAEAAAELLRQTLVKELDSTRPVIHEREQGGRLARESNLIGRLKSRVMPSFLSLVDDPSLKKYGEKNLIGSYLVDEEGVRAQRVLLIEKGVLLNLLSTRRPRKEILKSNGHARYSDYEPPKARISNLILESTEGLSPEDLRKRLIHLAREKGNDYGIILRQMDNPAITGAESSDFLSMMGRGGNEEARLTKPLMAVRLFVKDGREEPIRLGEISGVDIRSLKEISAVGKEPTIYNFLDSPQSLGLADDLRLYGYPSSIVTPSILLEDVLIRKEESVNPRLPLIQNPISR